MASLITIEAWQVEIFSLSICRTSKGESTFKRNVKNANEASGKFEEFEL